MLEQGSPEWYAIRAKSIGASDIPILMNESHWCTPYMLFERKLGYRTVEDNDHMKRGRDLEPYALSKLQNLFCLEFNPRVCFHPSHSWMMASLDAIDDAGKHMIEIKAAGAKDHDLAKKGLIPNHYYGQLQWQMHVTGLDSCFYYSFDGSDGILITCQKDNVYLEKAIDKAKEFYQCLMSLEPPALTAQDIVQREDHEWCKYAEEWRIAKRQIDYWKTAEMEARDKLIEMAGDSCAEGGGIRIARYMRRGAINYADIRELDGIDLEPYRKPNTIAWRIT